MCRALRPLLQEQTRAFVEQCGKAAPLAGGLGAKEAAAKEAAAKLPKLKKAKAGSKAGASGGSSDPVGLEMPAIAEASREGSAAAMRG